MQLATGLLTLGSVRKNIHIINMLMLMLMLCLSLFERITATKEDYKTIYKFKRERQRDFFCSMEEFAKQRGRQLKVPVPNQRILATKLQWTRATTLCY